jgi:hypothetical protein
MLLFPARPCGGQRSAYIPEHAIWSIKKQFLHSEFSKDMVWTEFRCRSAANRRKRRSISAVGGPGQNGPNALITIRFAALARRFSGAKTHFSAVDSGIGARLAGRLAFLVAGLFRPAHV